MCVGEMHQLGQRQKKGRRVGGVDKCISSEGGVAGHRLNKYRQRRWPMGALAGAARFMGLELEWGTQWAYHKYIKKREVELVSEDGRRRDGTRQGTHIVLRRRCVDLD